MASAGNNTFIEYITTPKDHFYLGPINNTLSSAANVLVYNPLNNEISYTLITNTPLPVQNLQAVTTAGSSTNLTCAFTNPTTGLTTTSNVSIGENLTVSGNVTCTNINTQLFTLSTGTTQSFTCFSARYNNYNVTVNITNSTSTLVSMNCTYNGVNASVWNYTLTNMPIGGLVTTTDVNGTPVPITNTLGITGHPYDIATFTVYNPFLQEKTFLHSTNLNGGTSSGNRIVNGYCINPPSNSFNQLTLTFSQTITGGTVSVRGFN